MLLSSFVSACLLAATASARCSRHLLRKASDTYATAQAKGKGLPNLADVFIYAENDRSIDINSGVLSQALPIAHNRSIHDTAQCATFTELIVTDPKNPYVIHTRIHYEHEARGNSTSGTVGGTNSTNSTQHSNHRIYTGAAATPINGTRNSNETLKANYIESIVSKPGDWAFNATGYLYWDSKEDWHRIPKDKRDSRAVIKAAGDAYFDRFNNASVVVPFGQPCARLEGGAYTGAHDLANNTCDIGGLPSTIRVTNRRYVIDEYLGVVDIFLGFPGLDRSVERQPVPDSHLFRVEGGKVRYIHTVSACFNAGCGMNGTTIPQKRGDWIRP